MKKLSAMGIEPIRNEEISYLEWITIHDNETKETIIQANYKFYHNILMHIKYIKFGFLQECMPADAACFTLFTLCTCCIKTDS